MSMISWDCSRRIGRILWTFENRLNDITGSNHNGDLDSLIDHTAFATDGRLFFDEKNTGKIRIM
ncbi:MAG: hypothetical protein DLM72_12015 [Candidatus Nitrosopolaris wilkensis]|nr:MAG: hypothetical protein DLM72_12015 [Candidatus Nitrosopolaris wilkensis]